jgi:multidrug efflux pump subunit AcrB
MAKKKTTTTKTVPAEKASKAPLSVEQSYLSRLKFTPDMANTWVAKYISNIRIVLLSILTIVLLGTVAYSSLPKRLNPEVKIPIVSIATVIPGAASKDVEQLATIPLEDSIRSLKGLDVVNSSSQENISVITVQFVSTVDRDKAKDDVQSAVDSVQLPSNAQDPIVRAFDFEDQPVWTFVLSGGGSYPDLMHSAQALSDEIDDLSRVDRVNTTGFNEQEITIEVQPEKLEQYAVSPFQLSDAIRKARANYPAGNVVTGSNNFSLSIDPEIESISDIRNLQLSIDGRVLTLGEVAIVQERSIPNQPETILATPDGQTTPAVVFYVYKTTASDIDDAGVQIEEKVHEYIEQNPKLKVTTILNTSELIGEQFDDLLVEFRSTIILVFITLLLFLGLSQALISSLTVPLTFLSSFFLMQYAGMSINFLTMFAFLLALGLLVDDTIVVVSAMTTYYKSGKFTPLQTGILVWRDTIIPIWSTTITTIWAFVPLLLATGIIGEFIKPIPIVVTTTMISSTAIAVLITLPLMIVLLKPQIPQRVKLLMNVLLFLFALAVVVALSAGNPFLPLILVIYFVGSVITWKILPTLKVQVSELSKNLFEKQAVGRAVRSIFSRISDHGVINVEGLGEKYRRLSLRILAKASNRRLVLFAVVIYSVFCFALLPLGYVKNEFFPKEGSDNFYMRLELPTGARMAQTKEQLEPILAKLRELPDVEFVTAEVGRSGTSNSISSALGNAQNGIYFSIRLKPEKERTTDSLELSERAREMFKNFEGGKISVIEESSGPPAGSDLQITLLGTNLDQLNAYADQIMTFLSNEPGVNNVEKSITESTSKVRFVPDQAKLVDNGVSIDAVGFALRTYASGFTLDQVNFDETSTDKTSVVFRTQTNSSSLSGLGQISVTNSKFQSIPLSALGTFRVETNPTTIAREDFRRTIAVSASVARGESITDKNKRLEEFADSLDLPSGYDWKTGGVNEENQKSVQSILQAMLVSAVLILITMVIQFQSFRKAMIVLIVIPLAVSSVFLAFALTGTPLSFPALIGVLSLFGIVVTNSMFIVDKINLNLKEGMPFNEAIADSGASRLEPIILTKLSTVLGLLPITLAEPLWRGLGGAIISGLLVASTIMLLFIPALYYEVMGDEREAHRNK